MYKRSIEDPDGVWSDVAKDFYWEKQVYSLPSTDAGLQVKWYVELTA